MAPGPGGYRENAACPFELTLRYLSINVNIDVHWFAA